VARAATLRFTVGDAKAETWCPDCSLPSGVTVSWIVESDPPGKSYPQVVTFSRCLDCGKAT
jgi:hypothetical protein